MSLSPGRLTRDEELAVASALLLVGGAGDEGNAGSTAGTAAGKKRPPADLATTTTAFSSIPDNRTLHNTTSNQPTAKRPRTATIGPDGQQVQIIQECHAVLGDRHCAGRTTLATVILREIKIKYKEKYKGKGVDHWYDNAMQEYYQRVKEKVPGFTDADYQQILVYSYKPKGRGKSTKTNDIIMNGRVVSAADPNNATESRVLQPNCFMYHNDTFPKYGLAKIPEAVKFFFNSKDAPTLSKEIAKYRSDFERLKQQSGADLPPADKIQFFDEFLSYCERILTKARDEEMAQQLLTSLNLIPTFKRLWETLNVKYRVKARKNGSFGQPLDPPVVEGAVAAVPNESNTNITTANASMST